MTPFDHFPNSDDQLQSDSKLLGEVLDYLSRMPATHATLSIARKVQDRLDDPHRRAAQQKAAREAMQVGLRHGMNYSPAGAPIIEAEVQGDLLRLWTPDIFKTEIEKAEWSRMLLNRLQATEQIHLSPGPALFIPLRGD